MLRNIYKRNIENIKKLFGNLSNKVKENAENRTNSLVRAEDTRKFQFKILHGGIAKDAPKCHSNSIYFLYNPKQMVLTTFLNPNLNLKPKFLLWNTLKRHKSTQAELNAGKTRKEIYPRNMKKLSKSVKRLQYSNLWGNPDAALNQDEFNPRCDDIYFLHHGYKCTALDPKEEIEEDEEEKSKAEKLEHKKKLAKQKYRYEMWRKDIRSFEFKKLRAPKPCFSEVQSMHKIPNQIKRKSYSNLGNITTPLEMWLKRS